MGKRRCSTPKFPNLCTSSQRYLLNTH